MNFISMNLVTMLYLVASVCFIQALKGLSSPATARQGNAFGMSGMAIAFVTTVALILKLRAEAANGGGVGLPLVVLGVVFPPVAGIMIAEYYVVRRWRNEIISTRPYVPRSAPSWVPVTVVVWPAAAIIGELLPFGQSSVNSLVLAFALYVCAGRLDLLRMRTRRATNRKVVGEASAA